MLSLSSDSLLFSSGCNNFVVELFSQKAHAENTKTWHDRAEKIQQMSDIQTISQTVGYSQRPLCSTTSWPKDSYQSHRRTAKKQPEKQSPRMKTMMTLGLNFYHSFLVNWLFSFIPLFFSLRTCSAVPVLVRMEAADPKCLA